MRILVVEDEPVIAMSLTWELEHAGHEVVGPAATLEEAMQLARAHRPELALLDIDLRRRGDGVLLAKQLRAINIPSVFVSGQDVVARENADLAIGYISKPYNPADIARSIAVLDAVIHGRSAPPLIPSSLRLFH
jgi:DNA-binding response OmpR family regulator